MGRLENRVCAVTGASSGIGRAIARRFAAEGAVVALLDPRETPLEGGEDTLSLIRSEGGNVEHHDVDVSDWTQLDGAIGGLVERYGALHVMVNNAAINCDKPLLETSQEEWDRVMAVNLRGVFFGCKRAVQQMVTQEPVGEARGRIVNISSQHGMVACPGDISYGVSKAGTAYMTRQIACDYASQGIVCNAVAPGKILTGRTDAIGEAAINYSNSRTPMSGGPLGRLGRPSDVANAALFLASDECTYMNGENVMVDGGWMAS